MMRTRICPSPGSGVVDSLHSKSDSLARPSGLARSFHCRFTFPSAVLVAIVARLPRCIGYCRIVTTAPGGFLSIQLNTRQIGDVNVISVVGRITIGDGSNALRQVVR